MEHRDSCELCKRIYEIMTRPLPTILDRKKEQ
jgi:hypothetical protein